MKDDIQSVTGREVRIVGAHPHRDETGVLTGATAKLSRSDLSELGFDDSASLMYEVRLSKCCHGMGACFANARELVYIVEGLESL